MRVRVGGLLDHPLSKLDSALREYSDSLKQIYPGPFVAFSYAQNSHDLGSAFFKEIQSIDLTYHEKPTEEWVLQKSIMDFLETFSSNGFQREDRRFLVNQLTFLTRGGLTSKGKLYSELFVSVGVSPEYFVRNPNNDHVDAMYDIDCLGINLVIKSLESNKMPWWVNTNYNFSNFGSLSPGRGQIRINNPEFKELIDRLKPELKTV